MVASIANFDQPRSFASVKPPRSRAHGGTQTDFESDSDMDRVAPGEISISIQTDTNPAHLGVTRKNSAGKKIMVDVADSNSLNNQLRPVESTIQQERIAESPQLFIPATPSPPPPPRNSSPPPTPLLQRKKMESKADEIINSHSELLHTASNFPPPPAALLQKTPEQNRKEIPEKFPEVKMTVQTSLGSKVPPIVPRKNKIKPEKFQKMKLSAARNAVEVHRRKSPQHEMKKTPEVQPTSNAESNSEPAQPQPPMIADMPRNTPVFSDAILSSVASVISDGRSTDGSEFVFVENSEKLEEMINNENRENAPQNTPSPIRETNLAELNLITDEALGTDKASDTEIESVKGTVYSNAELNDI